MTPNQIFALIIAVIAYVAFVIWAHFKCEDTEPTWLMFLSLPLNLIGFVFVFPFAIAEKIKLNKDYEEKINFFKNKKRDAK